MYSSIEIGETPCEVTWECDGCGESYEGQFLNVGESAFCEECIEKAILVSVKHDRKVR